jgi:hypothetical protein
MCHQKSYDIVVCCQSSTAEHCEEQAALHTLDDRGRVDICGILAGHAAGSWARGRGFGARPLKGLAARPQSDRAVWRTRDSVPACGCGRRVRICESFAVQLRGRQRLNSALTGNLDATTPPSAAASASDGYGCHQKLSKRGEGGSHFSVMAVVRKGHGGAAGSVAEQANTRMQVQQRERHSRMQPSALPVYVQADVSHVAISRCMLSEGSTPCCTHCAASAASLNDSDELHACMWRRFADMNQSGHHICH